MKREQVKENLQKVTERLKELNSEEKTFLYNTRGKHVDGHGEISEVENIFELVKFKSKVDEHLNKNHNETIQALGLTETEIAEYNKKVKKNYKGVSASKWNEDANSKLEEIRREALIKKLNKAKATLEKHLSDDDKFALDTEGIDELV